MEIAILLFLLSSSGRGGDLKKTLEDFLVFYRENRELIQMLFNKPLQEGAPQEERSDRSKNEEEKNRSHNEETGLNDILGEFLKRSTV